MSESQTRLILVCLGILLGGMAHISATRPAATPPRAPQGQNGAAPDVQPRAIIDKYCVTCHNERLRPGTLVLTNLDPARGGKDIETWENVVKKLRAGVMPPVGSPSA